MTNQAVTLENLQQLLDGRPYRDASALNYFPARDVIEPGMERLGNVDIARVEGFIPREVPLDTDGNPIIHYSRGLVEMYPQGLSVTVGDNDVFKPVIGLMYYFDTRNPGIKAFVGFDRMACLNTCVIGAEDVAGVQITDPNWKVIFDKIEEYRENLEDRRNALQSQVDFLFEPLTETRMNEVIGKVAKKSVMNNMTTNLTAMINLTQRNRDYVGVRNIYYKNGDYCRYDLWQAYTAEKHDATHIQTIRRPEQAQKAYALFTEE